MVKLWFLAMLFVGDICKTTVRLFLYAICFTSCLLAEGGFSGVIEPVFRKHCIQCHGEKGKVKGEVNLLKVKSLAALTDDLDLVSSLIDVLDFEEMPPEEEPQIDTELREKLISELKAIRNQNGIENRGFSQAPIRRMNRFQYNNAVTDLFELKCVVFALPERMMREHQNYFKPETGEMADEVMVGSRPLGKSQLIEARLAGVAPFPQDLRAEHGYDNRGDHLSMSPLLMESFLALSQSITQSPGFNPRNVGIWKSFFKPPAEDVQIGVEVETRVRQFLSRAFRHPVEVSVLERYKKYALSQLDSGVAFPDVMKQIAAATIASPKFLYLYEKSGGERINDFELASRLSFFLWGSIPDQELVDLAVRGELHKPDVLTAQFHRMMGDHRVKRFCDSFPSQWLQLERIISSKPNREEFPDFYFSKYLASMHMMMEPLLIFETVLIENQSITQLIDSDFTYRSDFLRKAYGEIVPKGKKRRGSTVTALRFVRLPITDRRYGGVITNAAVMTMTSGPERTQPITRGAWLAGVIFNNPPEPPPANVPPLSETPDASEQDLTLRERLSAHRKRADCKGCHAQIDPLGFALENYDPVGKWRDVYPNGRDIDMAGTLFRKHDFSDVVAFKDSLLAEKDRFARGFAGHLLSFALARELGPAGQKALDKIASDSASDDYRIQGLLRSIILSEPFLSKAISKSIDK